MWSGIISLLAGLAWLLCAVEAVMGREMEATLASQRCSSTQNVVIQWPLACTHVCNTLPSMSQGRLYLGRPTSTAASSAGQLPVLIPGQLLPAPSPTPTTSRKRRQRGVTTAPVSQESAERPPTRLVTFQPAVTFAGVTHLCCVADNGTQFTTAIEVAPVIRGPRATDDNPATSVPIGQSFRVAVLGNDKPSGDAPSVAELGPSLRGCWDRVTPNTGHSDGLPESSKLLDVTLPSGLAHASDSIRLTLAGGARSRTAFAVDSRPGTVSTGELWLTGVTASHAWTSVLRRLEAPAPTDGQSGIRPSYADITQWVLGPAMANHSAATQPLLGLALPLAAVDSDSAPAAAAAAKSRMSQLPDVSLGDVNDDGLTDAILLVPTPSGKAGGPASTGLGPALLVGRPTGELVRITSSALGVGGCAQARILPDLTADAASDVLCARSSTAATAPEWELLSWRLAASGDEMRELRVRLVPPAGAELPHGRGFCTGDVDGDGVADLVAAASGRDGALVWTGASLAGAADAAWAGAAGTWPTAEVRPVALPAGRVAAAPAERRRGPSRCSVLEAGGRGDPGLVAVRSALWAPDSRAPPDCGSRQQPPAEGARAPGIFAGAAAVAFARSRGGESRTALTASVCSQPGEGSYGLQVATWETVNATAAGVTAPVWRLVSEGTVADAMRPVESGDEVSATLVDADGDGSLDALVHSSGWEAPALLLTRAGSSAVARAVAGRGVASATTRVLHGGQSPSVEVTARLPSSHLRKAAHAPAGLMATETVTVVGRPQVHGPVQLLLTAAPPAGRRCSSPLHAAASNSSTVVPAALIPQCERLRVASIVGATAGAARVGPRGEVVVFHAGLSLPPGSKAASDSMLYTAQALSSGKTSTASLLVQIASNAGRAGSVPLKTAPRAAAAAHGPLGGGAQVTAAYATATAAASGESALRSLQSLNGAHNHPRHPNRGMAFTPLVDDMTQWAVPPPRRDSAGGKHVATPSNADARLPSPRLVSNRLCAQTWPRLDANGLSDAAVHLGQLIAHDTDFVTPVADYGHGGNKGIPVPAGDEWLDPNGTGGKMLHFRKSGRRSGASSAGGGAPPPVSSSSVRRRAAAAGGLLLTEQVNKVSSWLDLSVLYGSDSARCALLRSGRGGGLRAGGAVPSAFGEEANRDGTGAGYSLGAANATWVTMGRPPPPVPCSALAAGCAGSMPRDHLPFNANAAPNLNALGRRRESLVLSGDNRANVQPGLLALHTLFSRLHNANALLLARWAATGSLPDITDAAAAGELRWVRRALHGCGGNPAAPLCAAPCPSGRRLGPLRLALAPAGSAAPLGTELCLLPSWAYSVLPDEAAFEAARALTRAQYQAMVLYEYLPAHIGRALHDKLVGDYRGYSSKVDGRVLTSFATVAFRFGHSQVGRVMPRLASNWCPLAAEPLLSLRDAYFAPWRLLVAPMQPQGGDGTGADEGRATAAAEGDDEAWSEDGVDTVLRGMLLQHAQAVDLLMADDVRNLLFGKNVRFDLIALNIQRGRDHGTRSYQALRRAAGRARARSMDDIAGTSAAALAAPQNGLGEGDGVVAAPQDGLGEGDGVVAALTELYAGELEDVDAIVGAFAEPRAAEDASLGLTVARIVARQLRRLRQGDRFWFERPEVLPTPASFTPTVRGTRFADILRIASSVFDGPAGEAAWAAITEHPGNGGRARHDGALRTPTRDFAWTDHAEALGSSQTGSALGFSHVAVPDRLGSSLKPSHGNWSLGERFAAASDALAMAAIRSTGLCASDRVV